MTKNNPEQIHKGKVTKARTAPPRAYGEINIHKQKIKRKRLLYIMLYYYGEGANGKIQCRNAAAFKANRLRRGGSFSPLILETLQDVEVKLFEIYKIKDFQETWGKIHALANQDQYYLQEVHLFAHGGHDVLYLKNETFNYDLVSTLEILPFTKTGALVLHTCRGGRYEDNDKDDKAKVGKECIARAFSQHLNVKVIGQMTFSLFNPVTSIEGAKYYDMELPRRALSIAAANVVLWAYRIGNAVTSKHGQEPDYKILAKGQLWSARIFYPDGRAIYNIGKDMFNDSDLKYI